MRRWDRLLDAYLEQYRARGLSEQTVEHVTQRLTDWGQWMKRCRPRPVLERVDADLLVRYIESRSVSGWRSQVDG
jgi:site-specific recombinase XerD